MGAVDVAAMQKGWLTAAQTRAQRDPRFHLFEDFPAKNRRDLFSLVRDMYVVLYECVCVCNRERERDVAQFFLQKLGVSFMLILIRNVEINLKYASTVKSAYSY